MRTNEATKTLRMAVKWTDLVDYLLILILVVKFTNLFAGIVVAGNLSQKMAGLHDLLLSGSADIASIEQSGRMIEIVKTGGAVCSVVESQAWFDAVIVACLALKWGAARIARRMALGRQSLCSASCFTDDSPRLNSSRNSFLDKRTTIMKILFLIFVIVIVFMVFAQDVKWTGCNRDIGVNPEYQLLTPGPVPLHAQDAE